MEFSATCHFTRFTHEAPDLADAVRARLTAHSHHVLATLRRDGSPRMSGTEVRFHHDDLVLGSMTGARKTRDLRRDARYALHTHPGDETMADGDAKVSGIAQEVTDPNQLRAFADEQHPPEPFELFRLLLSEAVLTRLDERAGSMFVTTWRPGRPLLRYERHGTDPARRLP